MKYKAIAILKGRVFFSSGILMKLFDRVINNRSIQRFVVRFGTSKSITRLFPPKPSGTIGG